MSGPKWTPAQQAAIADRGGALLVSAAAGSGKTAVLTERAVRLITDPEHPVDADRLLIVTFTNAAAAELRRRGRRAPLAFVARTPAHAYSAYRVDAMQYLLQPVHQPEVSALLKRAVEPEYGPTLTVTTADGVRALTYAEIEYLECTHHIVHFHLTTGEDVASLSLRVPFSAVAQPLLADGRFVQPHRSYVVNLEAVQLLAPGEVRMRSGARIPIPRGREAAVREAFCARVG